MKIGSGRTTLHLGLVAFTLLIGAISLPVFGEVIYSPYTFTTLAGMASIGGVDGTNAAARFNNPANTVVDNAGNIYVADMSNHTIRKLTPVGTNWVSTTIAGLAGNIGS
ncbi:MAG: repeat containing protein, partial [Pedosphaera sp.]|nr:repeat containing protein [Pedosphaera sp.]